MIISSCGYAASLLICRDFALISGIYLPDQLPSFLPASGIRIGRDGRGRWLQDCGRLMRAPEEKCTHAKGRKEGRADDHSLALLHIKYSHHHQIRQSYLCIAAAAAAEAVFVRKSPNAVDSS